MKLSTTSAFSKIITKTGIKAETTSLHNWYHWGWYSVISCQPHSRLCTLFHLSVSVCLCVVKFYNQDISSSTNLRICATFTADTPYTVSWKLLAFGADHVHGGRLSGILVSITW